MSIIDNDSRVLFFYAHRHEFRSFYPTKDDEFYIINAPWENERCGDADYFVVWDHIQFLVAKEFNLDIIIVSIGFDVVIGDPLGECRVPQFGYFVRLENFPNVFSYCLRLKSLAD